MNPKQHTSWFSHIIWLSLSFAAIAYLSTSLHVVSDISQFLPATKSDSANNNIQFLLDELQQGNTARLLILRLRGQDAKSLADISRKLKSQLDKNPLFSAVHNGQNTFNPQHLLSEEYKTLYQYRYLLSQKNDFSSENLTTALKHRLAEIRSGINVFRHTLSSDPQNHFIEYLWQLTSRADTTQHYGVWFSKDKMSALLLVDLKLENFDLDSQQLAIETIQAQVKQFSNAELKLDITGAASMAVKTRAAIQSTSKWLSTIALILMAILFWWAYQSARLFLIAMLPLLTAVLFALTATNLIFQQVHGIIIAFGITLLGVSLDYPVHLFSHHHNKQTAQKTLQSIWPTLRLGGITTALAYLAMLGTGFNGLSQLAVFAISGLMVALFVTRWIVPVWLDKKSGQETTFPHHHYLSFFARFTFSLQHKIYIAVSTGFVCLFILIAQSDEIWSKNISDLSPIPESAKQLDQELRNSIGAPDVNHIFILSDADSESLLQRTEKLKSDLHALQSEKMIKHIFAVTDFLPSQKKQSLQKNRLPDTEALRDNLNAALSGLPFKKNFFNPFVNDIEKSKTLPPLTLTDFFATPLAKQLHQDIFYKNNHWISVIRLTGVNNEKDLIQWLNQRPELKQYYLNLRQATSSLMSEYQDTALLRFLLGSLIITIILLFVRPASRAVKILLPVFLAVLISISLQVLMGAHLTLFHILALLLIVGIGLDYSLFFDRRWSGSLDYQQRLHGIFVSAASTLITFGILAFSDIPVLTALGQTVTFGVLASFVLTFIFNINNNEQS